MNVSPVPCAKVLASSTVRPPFSSSSRSSISNAVHVPLTSLCSQGRALFPLFLALVAFPAFVSAAPPTLTPSIHAAVDKRQSPGPQGSTSSNSNGPPNGSISMSVWLPILLVTLVFVLFSFVTCVRRCAATNAAVTDANRTASAPATGITTRPYRRPRRTPSQISTKSLPAYMKEPGDQELVLFRGPSEMEDDPMPPPAMPTLAEEEDLHPEMRGATFDIALDRVESMDTMPDSSTADLVRRVSGSAPRTLELHHATMPHDHRHSADADSMDSVASDTEFLAAHQRGVSVDNSTESRGEAPSYTEAVSMKRDMTTVSLNVPEPSNGSSSSAVPPSLEPGRGRSRFSFLTQNPFSSHNHSSGALSDVNRSTPSIRSESPAPRVRSGSALSRLSTHDSHESHHSRTPSRNSNLPRSRSRSNSNLLHVFRSHSPGLHAGSSTISLNSISAPLIHTLKRAEFHPPKGGLTPDQIKLITSREALEKFGVPYGPDAVAAFSLSRERSTEMRPPPDFESATGSHQEPSSSTTEAPAQRSETLDATALQRSTSPSQSSLSPRVGGRAGSRASTVTTYATAPDLDGGVPRIQIVQTYASDDEGETDEADELRTARPMTPRTARPLSVSWDHERP